MQMKEGLASMLHVNLSLAFRLENEIALLHCPLHKKEVRSQREALQDRKEEKKEFLSLLTSPSMMSDETTYSLG